MPDQDALTIDGSQGEGGGQMVRSSMALSVVTGRPICLENIRAGRSKPGLQRQHLTAVRAAAEICSSELEGDELESLQIQFTPGAVQAGEYHFNVGSAGSAMLVLQTVLPPLLTAESPSLLTLEGGTHNQWAPPFDFLARAYLPLVNQMGVTVSSSIQRHGFYPAGGGQIIVEINPAEQRIGFDLNDRGRVRSRRVTALVAGLPEQIGRREVDRVVKRLQWPAKVGKARSVPSDGPGNVVFAEIECENVTEIFTAFGRRGVQAEKVADEVVQQVRRWNSSDVPVGEYLADQILLPLGLSAAQPADCGVKRGGTFRTLPLSQHSLTHIDILKQFLDIKIDVERDEESVQVTIAPPDV